MELIHNISIQRTKQTKIDQLESGNLEFGKYVSDHMFDCNYANGSWQNPAIKPFQEILLSPLTLALHYGQSIFEGLKAYKLSDGRISIFRIDKHFERLNRSLQRMCMPEVPNSLFEEGLKQLISLDKDWIPAGEGGALYIRPLIFASEAKFGVKVSDQYRFIIFSGPVSPVYQKPIKVKVERTFIRAAKGGTGYAKCSGNYGGAFYPTHKAREQGFDQVIWTDAMRHEYIEESGMMNMIFVIDGILVTPPLSDSILDGVTRNSLLQIAGSLGIPAEERPISIKEIIEAFEGGKLSEAFGAGTAAVVAPIGLISIEEKDYELPAYSETSIHNQLKTELEAIRTGIKEDVFGWNHVIV
jgi:branched-chain amino acid aminotransferase